MHWHVPSSPERVDIVGIPPIAVEVPIREMQQLTHQIEKRVK